MSDDNHLIERKTGSVELLKGNFLHAFRDTVQLPNLLATTAEQFAVNDVCADLAYSSHDNLLNIALAGLRQWGDRYLSEKPPRVLRRKADRKPVVAALVPRGADVLRPDEVEVVPGPGMK